MYRSKMQVMILSLAESASTFTMERKSEQRALFCQAWMDGNSDGEQGHNFQWSRLYHLLANSVERREKNNIQRVSTKEKYV